MLFSGLALLQVARSLARRKALAYWVAVLALDGVVRVPPRPRPQPPPLARRRPCSSPTSGSTAAASTPAPIPSRARRPCPWPPCSRPSCSSTASSGLRSLRAAVRLDAGNLAPARSRALGPAHRRRGRGPRAPSSPRASWARSRSRAGSRASTCSSCCCDRSSRAPASKRPRKRRRPRLRAWARRSLASFALDGDKHHLLVAGGRGLVAYAVRGGVALAAGDPLAAEGEMPGACRPTSTTAAATAGRRASTRPPRKPCPSIAPWASAASRWRRRRSSTSPSFSLAGGKRATLRAMVNKAAKQGLAVTAYDRAAGPDPEIDAQLEEISREWLPGSGRREMGFTVSRSPSEALDAVRVFLCKEGERVVAFCTWRPYRGDRAVVLDLMRKRPSTLPRGSWTSCSRAPSSRLRRPGPRRGQPRQRAARERGGALGAPGAARRLALRQDERVLRLQEPLPVQEEVRAALGGSLPRLSRPGGPAPGGLCHGQRPRGARAADSSSSAAERGSQPSAPRRLRRGMPKRSAMR